jgi:hypothetical protein
MGGGQGRARGGAGGLGVPGGAGGHGSASKNMDWYFDQEVR